MEFKDAAIALAGISVILLAIGLLTDGIVFYAGMSIALAALAIDFLRYALLISGLRRNLAVTRALSTSDLMLGSSATVSYDLVYGGKRTVQMQCSQQADKDTSVAGSPVAIDLMPGRQTIKFSAKPSRRGSHALKGLRMTVETWLFRGTLTAGGESVINTYLTMGSDRAGTGANRGRLQRIHLPGSEAIRRGFGSDFSIVRDFTPGDSTKNIDWARSSRSSTLVVRDFEDERTLPVFLIIDVDQSMNTGTVKTELESAIEIASLIASKVLLDNERVGIACFSRLNIVSYHAPAGGKDQMAYLRSVLSSVRAADDDPSLRAGFPTLQEAGAIAHAFKEASPVITEAIQQFAANVREDGFIKAITRASLSTGTPCNIIVITNLSMGVASLMSGMRIATYYGHNVSVALTPHIWYDGGEGADPEKCYDRYREAKDIISGLQGRNMSVIELSACERPESVLYRGRSRIKTFTGR